MTRKKAAAATPAETPAATPAETFVNADQRPDPPDPDTLVTVYPAPDLPEGSFLPGVGIAGAQVTPEVAAEWVAAGIATTDRGHAQGGPVRAGANYLVGESGPEQFIPAADGQVNPPAAPAQPEV